MKLKTTKYEYQHINNQGAGVVAECHDSCA